MAKVKLTNSPDIAGAEKKLRKELRKEIRNHLNRRIYRHRLVSSNWENHKPKYKRVYEEDGTEIRFAVEIVAPAAEGSTKGLSVYRLLNDGTSVRRAVMSSDWQSKTIPNFIGNVPGTGFVTGVLPSINLPGIKARNWDEEIDAEVKDQMFDILFKAFDNGLRAVFG